MPEAAKLRVYQDLIGGGYRWSLRSVDGEKIAESESSFPSKENCRAQARTVLEDHPSAKLQDLTALDRRAGEPDL